jgi:hypothetical protein
MSNAEPKVGPVKSTVSARPVGLIVGLGLIALALGLVLLRWPPPSARAADAPDNVFSAGRAMAVLGELLAEGQPHPVGSAAAERVRERIITRLESLGYEVEIQETAVCRSVSGARAVCAPVRNVVTRLAGQVDGPAVMLMAHYDSVGGGPGAADDTSSVAEMLEIARILKAEAPHRNPVIFLFTEGEEVGLLGAKGFVDEHPWAQNVGVVINLEARGSSGQSLLFETSDDNAWLIDAYAASVPRPSANSLSYEIYKLLPNDTDLTMFKEAGIAGLNFSFIDTSSHYHTALDNLAALDPRSVQHQGDSALAVARELAARDLSNPPAGNAVYLDLLGLFVIHWPAAWTLPLALAALLLLLVAAVQLIRQRSLSVRGLLLGLLAALLCIVLPILLGLGLVTLVGTLGDGPQPWYAYPLPTRLALWAGTLLCGGLVAASLGRRAGLWGLGLGAWLLWALLSVVLSLALTGVAILLLVPTLVAALLLVGVVLSGRAGSAMAREVVLAVAAAFAGLIFLGLALMFEVATGFAMSPAITLSLGLVVAALSPLLALPGGQAGLRRGLLLGSGAVVVVAVVAALLVPPYSKDSPQPVNLYHVTDGDSGEARWVSVPYDDVTPDPLRQQFGAEAVPIYPWSSAMYLTAPAEATGAPAPTVEVVSDETSGETRTLTLQPRSPRGADALDLLVPLANLEELSVAGRALPVERDAGKTYYYLSCYGRSCDGLEITLRLASASPTEALVVDYTMGLPASGAPLFQARPATAVSYQEGDLTVIWRRIEL